MLPSVWPLPISLATTFGISVDYFSSPYLDVSVQAVPHAYLFDSVYVTTGLLWWVSPFGHPRIVAYLQLPEAFRSLSRPSSAPDAKAFPLRSFQLDLYSFYCLQAFVEKSISGFSIIRIMQAHKEVFLLAEIVSITLKFLFPYCCLLITFLHSMFSFQGTSLSFFESSLKSPIGDFNQPSREGIILKVVCERALRHTL